MSGRKYKKILQKFPRDLSNNTLDDRLIYIPNDEKQFHPFYTKELLVKKFTHYKLKLTNKIIEST